jgi:hypothetical protein
VRLEELKKKSVQRVRSFSFQSNSFSQKELVYVCKMPTAFVVFRMDSQNKNSSSTASVCNYRTKTRSYYIDRCQLFHPVAF